LINDSASSDDCDSALVDPLREFTCTSCPFARRASLSEGKRKDDRLHQFFLEDQRLAFHLTARFENTRLNALMDL